ncbi:MAG: formamidopyrimidine-DNA glycosylase [Chloroflexota bacterium]|nr:formamidopyrimidine-DNA glycosylase [Chloroflexota bacterium]
MPELPEVETIARALREGANSAEEALIGRRIEAAVVLWPRTLANRTPQAFSEQIRGQTIQSVGRRGKFLVLTLSRDTLLVHLRMSGDMRVEQRSAHPVLKHDRLILELDNSYRLAFNDTRKFGRAWLLADPQEVLDGLGPEPLDPALDATAFHEMLAARHRQLKPLLMDQSFLAGLGNIYTDEALHLAKLHPLLSADSLSQPQAARLLDAIRSVLSEGIRRNGASIDWVYRGGDFQNHFRVYGRGGESCPECGATIERLVVGQRGTHICPNCQPKPD